MSSRWRNRNATYGLVGVAIVFAIGNLWTAAARSTIPLRLDDVVVRKEIRREKHPGRDDVHFVDFSSGRRLHVDRAVYDALKIDDHVIKYAWSFDLVCADRMVPLSWSPDVHGMAWAMPLILLAVAYVARSVSRDESLATSATSKTSE